MKKILIVDRYSSVRELLAEDLAAEGNTVVPIGNPNSIPNLIHSFAPHLIILDPFIDGKWQWDLLKEIREENPGLPVLIFTANPLQGDRRQLLADGWVMKSPLFDALKEKINGILNCRLRAGSSMDRSIPGAAEVRGHRLKK